MERNIYLDNLKAVLIFFVVLGHYANLNRSIPLFGVMNNVIYSYHMPLFIFVSGYLSKNIFQQRKKEIEQILYAYIVFEILNLIFTKLTSIGEGGYDIFRPTGQDWYLLGLFFWRLFLPYCNLFQENISLFFILLIAFVVGFFQEFNTFLGLYRIIYFMPFFVLGSYCSDINLLIEKYVRFRALLFSILFISFMIITVLSFHGPELNKAIAYAFTPLKGYSSLDMRELYLRFILRIIGFMSSVVISFCFLFIVPNRKTFFTKLGRHTLNVYLLHMFFVYSVVWLFKKLSLPVLFMIITSVLTSLLFTMVLSSDLVGKIMLPLTNGTYMITSIKKRFSRKSGLGLLPRRE